MKQCPVCRTTYTDETLSFCLADGAALTFVLDEQATFVRSAGEQMRVEIPQDAPPPQFQPVTQLSQSSGSGLKILLVVIALGVLVLVIIGAVGALYYFNSREKDTVSNISSPSPNKAASPISSPSPSPTDETSDLKNQIANLERMINEQKNQNRAVNVPPSTVPNPTNIGTTARVNSPGDGFLALRSFPSSEIGTRVRQIPHGAAVSIAGCLNSTRVGNKTGRWCRANYNGYTGWVFDAWLIY